MAAYRRCFVFISFSRMAEKDYFDSYPNARIWETGRESAERPGTIDAGSPRGQPAWGARK